ncbi:MAG TPA: metalloregulator ArsR/SmtB family transcription factor [Pyrinomonadaceae bacterium]|nr:metalloregulator ArsR/SmtB family transcription factor [Pyrinomonadaceae bacterium]
MERINEIERMLLGLAEQTRLRILNILKDGEASVSTITNSLKLAQPKISRHLAYLRESGVVVARRDGKQIYYQLGEGSRSSGIVRAVIRELEKVEVRGQDVLIDDRGRFEHSGTYTSAQTNISHETEEMETYLL